MKFILFSQQKDLSTFLIENLTYIACDEKGDTLFRPIIVSNDLIKIFNLKDTSVIKKIEVNGNQHIKIFQFRFYSGKMDIYKKEEEYKTLNKTCLLSTLYGEKFESGLQVLSFLNACMLKTDIMNKNKGLVFSGSDHLLIHLSNNLIVSTKRIN